MKDVEPITKLTPNVLKLFMQKYISAQHIYTHNEVFAYLLKKLEIVKKEITARPDSGS